MSKVTIKQSRRFASRALAVFNRNQEASAPIKAYEGSLTASAPAVIEKFDRLIVLARERREAKERRDEALAELFQTLGSWAGSVRVSIPGFRKADFRATPRWQATSSTP